VPDLHESSWRRSGRRDSDHYSRSFSGHCPARFAPDCGVSNVRLSIVNASNEATLRTVLASVANKMLADFNASSVAKHSGSKGTVREAQLLSNYLRKYLPRNVIAEHSGEVVAANGAVSGQCDIVILIPRRRPSGTTRTIASSQPSVSMASSRSSRLLMRANFGRRGNRSHA
jgi:hypothetical protein